VALYKDSNVLTILTQGFLYTYVCSGKGTNAVDGAALVTALARHLAGDSTAPIEPEHYVDESGQLGITTRCKALLTLHFLEVFKQGELLSLPTVSLIDTFPCNKFRLCICCSTLHFAGLISVTAPKIGRTALRGVIVFHMQVSPRQPL